MLFGKPSEDFFVEALSKLGLKADECVVVGDYLKSDIDGANNAGISSVFVKTGKGKDYDSSNETIEPFLIIESFRSLLDYL